MQAVLRLMMHASANDLPVLLQGEAGVGKRSAAKEIHKHSPRRSAGFGSIRCTNCEEDRLASDLFGYEEGAWPGAAKPKEGLIKTLARGTLYIEDIVRSGPHLQVELLRLLEEQTYRPFRSHKSISADVRIIASTTEPLAYALQAGSFLPELYYRLSAHLIEMPPLRARPFDIPQLAHTLLAEQKIQIAGEAMDILMNYQWPGNLDELEAVLLGVAKWCDNRRIEIRDLPAELVRAARTSGQKYSYIRPPDEQKARQAS
jgi:DNA-binding NtrC family response regulator